MGSFEGRIEEIIYHNEENGYTVCSVNVKGDFIPVVGKIFFVRTGECIRFDGDWVKHPVYGEQMSIKKYEKYIPDDSCQIREYLCSGIFKGIGEKTAEKIVDKFGDDTINIIRFSPDKLTQIKGINIDKAQRISEEFEIQRELNDLMAFFTRYNLPPATAAKVYKKMYGASIDIITSNPYMLTDEEFGLSFKTVDTMAMDIGISSDSHERIRAAIFYVLRDESNNGHTYINEDILTSKVNALLNINSNAMEDVLISMLVKAEVYLDKTMDKRRIYSMKNYSSEVYTAEKIAQLAEINYEIDESFIMSKIRNFEEQENIAFASNQLVALMETLKSGVVVITGGPGTGKTTIIKAIINLFETDNKNVLLTAPTGRAAKRMSESTGRVAKTIHRLLGVEFNEESRELEFTRDEKNPLNAEVIVVDETSMVDINVMAALLRAVTFPTRLVLVGDIDQLPSVGPGNVLKDIIESKTVKIVKLTDIFRQAQESMIVMNAHRINSGEMPQNNIKDSDYYFISETNSEKILQIVIDLYSKRLPAFYGFEPVKDIQVITPSRKGSLGVIELNKKLQQIINPSSSAKTEKKYFDVVFRIGDRVMQIKNNYNIQWFYKNNLYKESLSGEYNSSWKIERYREKIFSGDSVKYDDSFGFDESAIENGKGVFNGDTGIIVSIDDDENIHVIFDDDREVIYDNSVIDQLEHAYSITIHKSQGSEFPAVIIPIVDGPKVLYTKSLIYTAVTRAKSLVVIVGNTEVIRRMINNDLKSVRFSSLKERLK